MKRLASFFVFAFSLFTLCLPLSATPHNDFDAALQMLADFTPYLYNQYQEISDKNSKGEPLATFKGENTFGNNEQGVRNRSVGSVSSRWETVRSSTPTPPIRRTVSIPARTTSIGVLSAMPTIVGSRLSGLCR